ncbi:MAG TPA: Crp/Fnr family transcriptional regulator [Azospirillum sp.]|nr:Crp/Fnr family transcriptional regulator [Azospirillum sp.]
MWAAMRYAGGVAAGGRRGGPGTVIDLDSVAAFRELSEEGRRRLAHGVVAHRFPAGKTIVEKGQDVSGAYFVLDGRLRVFTYSESGKEATLYQLARGETCVVALNSLFNDLLYPAWVQCEAPTTVAIVAGPVYRALFDSERSIRDLTVRALSTLVFRLMGELEEVHSCTLDQRLARFLLLHASGERVLRKTQQEIAAHVGTSREVVARLMARFAARGWIDTKRGRVTILRAGDLADVVRG